tara:strand:- start:590 stop:832 length:243 start_codon:yes stop_codon:yes gene_type:complete
MENNLTPQETFTPEQVQKHIAAAFDSVNLINELNAVESLTQEQVDSKERNVQHLEIMIAKEWFVEALTEEQTSIINQLIS